MDNVKLVKVSHYQIHKDMLIGKGQFGQVYSCTDEQNQSKELCAKIITEKIEDEKTLREIDLMNKLKQQKYTNPNIVGIEMIEKNNEQIIIILEKCECDLQKQMDNKRKGGTKFTPQEATLIIEQIINGYKVLYDEKILHRDLKPANILYKQGFYKIADFGMARIEDPDGLHTKAGTPKYVAPQLFFSKTFTNQADVFSLGIIYYELIFGTLPYKANNIQDIRRALGQLQRTPIKVDRTLQGVTEEISSLIEQMLQFNEDNRIKWTELFDHPLFQQNNFNQWESTKKQSLINAPQFSSTFVLSDQLYQIALFFSTGYNLMEKFTGNINQNEIKLTECFFEHTKAKKQQQNQGWFSLNQVEEQLRKIKIIRNQNLVGLKELIKPVEPNYFEYFNQLFELLTECKFYKQAQKHNFEYLQLLYIFETIKEVKNLLPQFPRLYNKIIQIAQNYSNEAIIIDFKNRLLNQQKQNQ